LRAHPLAHRELADAARAFAVEAAEDAAVGDREAVLGPQAADQLASTTRSSLAEEAVSVRVATS